MDYLERLYSEAFEDGFDYAIEKLFSDSKADLYENKKGRLLGLLGTGRGGNVSYLSGRSAARRAMERGESDKEVKKAALKASALGGSIAAGVNIVRQKRGAAAANQWLKDLGIPAKVRETPLAHQLGGQLWGSAAGALGARMNAKESIKRRDKALHD